MLKVFKEPFKGLLLLDVLSEPLAYLGLVVLVSEARVDKQDRSKVLSVSDHPADCLVDRPCGLLFIPLTAAIG